MAQSLLEAAAGGGQGNSLTVSPTWALRTKWEVVCTDKCLPRSSIFTLAPTIGPSHHHRVVLHAPKATGLDEVGNALPQLGRHHQLAEPFHLLCLHQVLYGLKKRTSMLNCFTLNLPIYYSFSLLYPHLFSKLCISPYLLQKSPESKINPVGLHYPLPSSLSAYYIYCWSTARSSSAFSSILLFLLCNTPNKSKIFKKQIFNILS